MSALEHARGLLVMARKDFDALFGMVDNPLFAEEIFGFHAQQAIDYVVIGRISVIASSLNHKIPPRMLMSNDPRNRS